MIATVSSRLVVMVKLVASIVSSLMRMPDTAESAT
jgi:hypothetical protein